MTGFSCGGPRSVVASVSHHRLRERLRETRQISNRDLHSVSSHRGSRVSPRCSVRPLPPPRALLLYSLRHAKATRQHTPKSYGARARRLRRHSQTFSGLIQAKARREVSHATTPRRPCRGLAAGRSEVEAIREMDEAQAEACQAKSRQTMIPSTTRHRCVVILSCAAQTSGAFAHTGVSASLRLHRLVLSKLEEAACSLQQLSPRLC
jgi:hypothetical protein